MNSINFMDLGDSIGADEAEDTPRRDAAGIRKAAHIANGGEAVFDCPACKGSGQWKGRFKTGRCFKCDGKGKVSKGTAAALKGQQTYERNQQQARMNFDMANPGLIEAIRGYPRSDFLTKLNADYEEKGWLTDGQVAAAHKTMAKFAAADEARAAERAKEKKKLSGNIGVERINKLFETAMENGLKRPMFRTENLTVKLAKRHADTLYVMDRRVVDWEGGKHGAYVGKIVNGVFEARSEALPDTLKLLVKVAKNPLKAAVEYGRSTGICCCCGIELTDPKSVAAGIGPVCVTKWGM